jgi:hypothetical protein
MLYYIILLLTILGVVGTSRPLLAIRGLNILL